MTVRLCVYDSFFTTVFILCLSAVSPLPNIRWIKFKVSNQATIVNSDNLLRMLFATKAADEIAMVEQSHCLWLLVGVLLGSL